VAHSGYDFAGDAVSKSETSSADARVFKSVQFLLLLKAILLKQPRLTNGDSWT